MILWLGSNRILLKTFAGLKSAKKDAFIPCQSYFIQYYMYVNFVKRQSMNGLLRGRQLHHVMETPVYLFSRQIKGLLQLRPSFYAEKGELVTFTFKFKESFKRPSLITMT